MLRYARSKKFWKYFRDNWGEAIYTVEAVSERLGVPRPTLYRYLKAYSIPYQRSSGRISIPDESVERIRRVRELHDEGLGTAAVRKRVQDGDTAEVDRIAERLDQLSEAVTSSQRGSGSRSVESVSSNQALHIILARQSVMLQAIYNLNEMVEELLSANGRPRRSAVAPLDDASLRFDTPPDDILEVTPFMSTVGSRSTQSSYPSTVTHRPYPDTPTLQRRDGFETLARKRRRNTVALIASVSLVLCAGLWFLIQSL